MSMASQKYEPMLELALELDDETRRKTVVLNAGVEGAAVDAGIERTDVERDAETNENRWTVAVRYSGSLDRIRKRGITVQELTGNYAVLTMKEEMLKELYTFPEIIYVELPKYLFSEVTDSLAVTCIAPTKRAPLYLTGAGVIGAVIDTGIDYRHPYFRNPDGSSRILAIYDQGGEGEAPEGFIMGAEYKKEEIDKALMEERVGDSLKIVPTTDFLGHGTHVAGIMSRIANECEILAVKLRGAVPTTIELMLALEYVYREAVKRQMPVAVNISIGSSLGSHDGLSILETYIDNLANLWKMNICVGSGNEGDSSGHQRVYLSGNAMGNPADYRNLNQHQNRVNEMEVEFEIGSYETRLYLQIWKEYRYVVDFELKAPGSGQWIRIPGIPGENRIQYAGCDLYIFYGEPSPYSVSQEIYIQWLPGKDNLYLTQGIWVIKLTGEGVVDLWMPDSKLRNLDTKFLNPDPDITLVVPSSANAVISVGAYDGQTDAFAAFSGRGFTRKEARIKPDLVAPGVNIVSAAPGGGVVTRSGTSMATPFVTASAILMMEWGIVRGNDPYLYGEKLKAHLIRNAKNVDGTTPNQRFGWGTLCLGVP